MADGEDISIHALREEGDQDGQAKANRAAAISIHALREEGDRRTFLNLDEFGEFLSTPSARRATKLGRAMLRSSRRFLSTPSARRATEEQ